MRGIAAVQEETSRILWPGGDSCTFDLDQVRALGKQELYGSFVSRFLVRLLDGQLVFVVVSYQSAAEQTWLRQLSRRELTQRRKERLAGTVGSYPTRDCPEVIRWIEVDAADEDRRP